MPPLPCMMCIAWFAHRTKSGKDSNWQGTSSGAKSDMLSEILGKVKEQGFSIMKWLKSVGVKYKAWHEKICTHFEKRKK